MPRAQGETRFVAVDWSGAVAGAEKKIWLAESRDGETLAQLRRPGGRGALRDELLRIIAGSARVVMGLDFSFSFPAWFARELGAASGPAVWECAAGDGERWLRECPRPFWGRAGHPRRWGDAGDERPALRRTEVAVWERFGVRPKSAFQVGGAGAVGTGTIRGMPLLLDLRAAGGCVWPFDPPGWPRVVEIYPRLFARDVVKSRPEQRRAHLAASFPRLAPEHVGAATGSDDAFDAAIAALGMAAHAGDLEGLPGETDPVARLEGRIWYPGWRVGVSRSTATFGGAGASIA